MNKVILVFFIIFLLEGCEINILNLNSEQQALISKIQKEYNSKDIEIERIKEIYADSIIDNSINIRIINSTKIGIDNPNIDEECDKIFFELLKTFQGDQSIENINILFSEEVNYIVYRRYKSSGKNYNKELINNTNAIINSPQYLLKQMYIESERTGNYTNLLIYSDETNDKHPDVLEAIKYRGLACLKLGDFEAAKDDLLV